MKTFGTLDYAAPWFLLAPEPHVTLRAKRIFPKIATGSHGTLKLSHTPENARELVWFLERFPLDVTHAASVVMLARAAQHREQEALLHELLAGRAEARPFELALPPRDYQRIAADIVMRTGGLLCADDLGLGKTITGICVLSAVEARPALVVTMTHLPWQWEDEVKKFAPGLRTHVVRQSEPYDLRYGPPSKSKAKKRRGQLVLAPELEPALPDVIICPYSKITGWAETLAPIVKSVIFDEVQELRHPTSQKYTSSLHIAQSVPYRLGLSATPVYNYGNEIFNIVEVVMPGALGARDEFLREWCGEVNARGQAIVRDPNALGMHLRAMGVMLRRTRKEVGRELPPLQKIPHYLEIDAAPLAEIESAAAELARLILAHNTPFEQRGAAAQELDMKLRQATGLAKAPHVADFVRMIVETGEPVVLFGWHREVYSIWMDKLRDLNPVLYTGTESTKQKADSFRKFTEGETMVLIMSLRSGAGLDGLQHVSNTSVFGELDWSPKVHDQCSGRQHRDGQKKPSFAYYLLSREGSDPVIADVLGLKAAQSDGIVDPNAPILGRLQGDGGSHVKKLAEAYLARAAEKKVKREDA